MRARPIRASTSVVASAAMVLLMLHVVEAVVQAYIFGMLALVYIASGLQSQKLAAGKSDGSNNGEAG